MYDLIHDSYASEKNAKAFLNSTRTRKRSDIALMKEIVRLEDELKNKNDALLYYRAAFIFLEKQEWFQNNRHHLTEWAKDCYSHK